MQTAAIFGVVDTLTLSEAPRPTSGSGGIRKPSVMALCESGDDLGDAGHDRTARVDAYEIERTNHELQAEEVVGRSAAALHHDKSNFFSSWPAQIVRSLELLFEELDRSLAAAHRYEQLRITCATSFPGRDPAGKARQVYDELYGGRDHRSAPQS